MAPVIIALAQLPQPLFAVACSNKNMFFFLPSWYEYLPVAQNADGTCAVQNFAFPHDLLPIGLAIIDILVRLAGLVAIISIIIAGVTYITASGNPEKAASARKRIYNSLIGLAIVFIAAAVVAFIGNSLS